MNSSKIVLIHEAKTIERKNAEVEARKGIEVVLLAKCIPSHPNPFCAKKIPKYWDINMNNTLSLTSK